MNNAVIRLLPAILALGLALAPIEAGAQVVPVIYNPEKCGRCGIDAHNECVRATPHLVGRAFNNCIKDRVSRCEFLCRRF